MPELVQPELLHQANARIAAASALARFLGTAGGTAVIGIVGATRTLILDAVSYLISALCASRLPASVAPLPLRRRMRAAVREGFAHVRRDSIQRHLVLATGLHAFADGLVTTYFAYHLLTALTFGSTGLGLVVAAAGTGSLLGALITAGSVRRFGTGAVLLAGFAAYPICGIPLLLAGTGTGWVIALTATSCVQAAAATAASSTQRTLRQQLCPPALQSRVQQISVCLVAGARLLAAVTAGAIAHTAGVPAALLTGTALLLLPPLLLWSSPARRLTALPASKEAP